MLVLTSEQKESVRSSIVLGDIFSQYEREVAADALDARMVSDAQISDASRMLSLIRTHGLTAGLYGLVDPGGVLLLRMTQDDAATFESTSDTVRQQLENAIVGTLEAQLPAGMSEEGLREALHSDKVREWTGVLLSFLVNPKTAAQKQAGAAATAAGLGKKEVSDAIRKAGPTFFKGLFRSILIGTIADVVIESTMKIMDKIVNAGRVYGSAAQVQANIKSIQEILAKIKQAADLKVAVDGSNADQIEKQADQILEDIQSIYHNTPSYTMTLGKETGWTASLLQSTGKTYDQTVKDTDALSQSVTNAAQGEITIMTDDKGTPNPAAQSAVKERNHTVAKGIRLVNKLVTPTTRVFTELTKHIDTKGASTVMKTDASKGDAASEDTKKS